MTPSDRALLAAGRWFGALPAERQNLLLERGRDHSVSGGARIYSLGDPPDGLRAVLAGEVRLVNYPADGVEAVGLLAGPGGWFGEVSTLDGGPRTHDAIAFGPVRMLHVAQAAIDSVASVQPLLYHDLALILCAHMRSAQTFIAQSLAQPISARLARALTAAARSGEGDAVRMRQEDLAAMIGVSRQTINKELKQLEVLGLITRSYGRIRVRDASRLRAAGHPER